MKRLQAHALVPQSARSQLDDYRKLLASSTDLGERADILPFFKTRRDLCMLFTHYIPAIRHPDVVADEFVIYGDFRADLIVGDSRHGKYLLVEFEDGTSSSVFSVSTKTAPVWASRFEGAFSQIVDWLWKLEDMRSTADFTHVFGARDVAFDGLIVTGKGMALAPQEVARLKWRIDKVRVDSKAISFVSYDDFYADADLWLTKHYRV